MTSPISEIWSGGQTGVDQGALEAAKEWGARTGGWMPKGFLTEGRSRPEFAVRYGMREAASAEYPPRTQANAKETDGTIWLEGPEDVDDDPGYRTTSLAAEACGKPFFRIPLATKTGPAAAEIAQWAARHSIKRLNIAGPRASRWPEGQNRAREIVRLLLLAAG